MPQDKPVSKYLKRQPKDQGAVGYRYKYPSNAKQIAGWDIVPQGAETFTVNHKGGAIISISAHPTSLGLRVYGTLRDRDGTQIMTISKEFLMSREYDSKVKKWEPNHQKVVNEVTRELQNHYNPGKIEDFDNVVTTNIVKSQTLLKDLSIGMAGFVLKRSSDELIRLNREKRGFGGDQDGF